MFSSFRSIKEDYKRELTLKTVNEFHSPKKCATQRLGKFRYSKYSLFGNSYHLIFFYIKFFSWLHLLNIHYVYQDRLNICMQNCFNFIKRLQVCCFLFLTITIFHLLFIGFCQVGEQEKYSRPNMAIFWNFVFVYIGKAIPSDCIIMHCSCLVSRRWLLGISGWKYGWVMVRARTQENPAILSPKR